MNIETLKCLRDGKNIEGVGWMVVTLKGSIDNTNDLKWTINHISSCSQHLANKNARGCKPRKRWKQEKGKMFERASKIFSLLLPLTVSPSQPASHTEPRMPWNHNYKIYPNQIHCSGICVMHVIPVLHMYTV